MAPRIAAKASATGRLGDSYITKIKRFPRTAPSCGARRSGSRPLSHALAERDVLVDSPGFLLIRVDDHARWLFGGRAKRPRVSMKLLVLGVDPLESPRPPPRRICESVLSAPAAMSSACSPGVKRGEGGVGRALLALSSVDRSGIPRIWPGRWSSPPAGRGEARLRRGQGPVGEVRRHAERGARLDPELVGRLLAHSELTPSRPGKPAHQEPKSASPAASGIRVLGIKCLFGMAFNLAAAIAPYLHCSRSRNKPSKRITANARR